MRLYSTLQRGSSKSCRRPTRARCACTSAGRRSTSARTSATRGRSCSACGCAAGCAHRGYDATLVHNITDVNDKIYDAAPGASAELAARATRVVHRGHRRPRARAARRRCRRRREHIPGIVRFIEELLERGFAYAVEGDVYFRVARDPQYGRLSGQRPDQMEQGEEPNALKEDPRDFALWKANKPGEDTSWDVALGPRPAGLAHRVLGDGGGGVRAGVRDPRRRARPRLPASRERARAVERARPRVRAHLDAQRHARVRRREDVEVARQRRLDPERARHVGDERSCCSSS